jgi:lipoprotein-anchoring transpeptidase ErfK/SrfK
MSGFNPDGTKYLQPHVQWINYFYGGDAVHAVYWHPLSWFGAINSSHGCVGVSTDDGKWVYDWAPIGTTVITHA